MIDASNPLDLFIGLLALLFLGGIAAGCLLLVAVNVIILMTSEFDRIRPIFVILCCTGMLLMLASIVRVALP